MVPVPETSALMDLGFLVVTPEYRLAPQVSVREGPIVDAKDCVLWAQNELPLLLRASYGIEADGQRIVAMGHSAGANLALHLGSVERPPSAILDFYGPNVFGHAFWSQPLSALASIPDLPQDFLDKVYEGPTLYEFGPMIIDGKPDLSTPRNAWLMTTLREGNNIVKVAGGDDVNCIDPVVYFKESFPPTCFIHGDLDEFAPTEVSHTAYSKLQGLGVESKMVTARGQGHVFDIALQKEHVLFEDIVMSGLVFLRDHV